MILQDLLNRRKFQHLKVLNSNPDLSRTVFTVESTETPDVAKYIPPNTLLLMTGMAFKDDPLRMCTFLEELDKRSCAGLAIKLGRFIDTLDDRVLAAADQLGLPLLQIPIDVTLGNVYQDVLSFIWNNQNDYLLGALNAQRKISNLILQGSSLKSIINNMTMILNKPVMVMDLFGNILEYGYIYTRADRKKTAETVESMIKKKQIKKADYTIFKRDGKSICVYPVKGVSRHTNYIIISDFEPEEKEENALIMEQLIMALEMYFYRDLYVKYNRMKAQEGYRTLLFDQLEKKPSDDYQLLKVGGLYGLKRMPEYRFALLELGTGEKRRFNRINFSKREERYILIYDWINHLLEDEEDIILFPQESKWRYLFLIQGNQVGYRDFFIKMHEAVKEKFHLDITFGLGGAVSNFLNVGNSLSEAEQCLMDGSADDQYPYLLSYKPKNMMELFKLIPEREMKYMCEHTLKELAYPQDEMQEELRQTLYCYLFSNSSITKTAETMFLHRNTIKYRLKKCEELLKTDLSEVSNCFQIQLALIMTEYAQ